MRTTAWGWLVLLLIPGCLLVQPLDDANPDGEGNAGSGNQSSLAGGAGRNTAGSGSPAGGSGNRAGSGNAGSGNRAGSGNGAGSANGGSPGTDFSLFTGTWVVQAGSTIDRICDDGEQYTDPVDWTADEFVEGGSKGDLLLNPGTPCELIFDVDDGIAYARSGQSCTQIDSIGLSHELDFSYVDFEVHPDGKLGLATADVEEIITLPDDSLLFCSAVWTIHYER